MFDININSCVEKVRFSIIVLVKSMQAQVCSVIKANGRVTTILKFTSIFQILYIYSRTIYIKNVPNYIQYLCQPKVFSNSSFLLKVSHRNTQAALRSVKTIHWYTYIPSVLQIRARCTLTAVNNE